MMIDDAQRSRLTEHKPCLVQCPVVLHIQLANVRRQLRHPFGHCRGHVRVVSGSVAARAICTKMPCTHALRMRSKVHNFKKHTCGWTDEAPDVLGRGRRAVLSEPARLRVA